MKLSKPSGFGDLQAIKEIYTSIINRKCTAYLFSGSLSLAMMMKIIRCNCCGNFIKLINSVIKVILKVVIHLVLKMPQLRKSSDFRCQLTP